MTILVVSHLFEPSVNRVVNHLDKMGVAWARLNTEEFPLYLKSDLLINQNDAYGILDTSNGTIDSREINSVWFRRTSRPALPKYLSEKDKNFVRSETNAFLNGLLDFINGYWINKPTAERAAGKLRQLKLAASLGFKIPKTLVTNNPDSVRNFAATSPCPIIFKPISGFAPNGADFSQYLPEKFGDAIEIEPESCQPIDGMVEIVFSQLLTTERLAEIDTIRISPVIFQEYINKLFDVRVTVVGERIFTCRIHSQKNQHTAIDFRKMATLDSLSAVPHSLHVLPDEINSKILLLMKKLDLRFGCIDLVETNDGEYVFLEVNPSGQWMWIEDILGIPISEALAVELANPS